MSKLRPIASLSFLLIANLTSCVSTKNVPLSPADRATMRGKTIVSSNRNMPEFAVIKPETMMAASLGGAVGGAIAGSIAASQGAAEVAKHHLPVPENTISMQLLKNLVAKTGTRPLATTTTKVSNEKPETIASQYRPADYVLDIHTTSWMGIYYPFTISKYSIIYAAKMRLIDSKSGKVIAEGFSSYQGKDKTNAPDFNGIYANDAAFLRAETKKGTDAAIHQFSQQF